MSINWETIQVDGSPMRTYVAVPEGKGPHPAVIVAQHAFGVDESMQDAVHRLYRAGYAVASPELYCLLVLDRGWSPARYEEWLRSTLVQQLLE